MPISNLNTAPIYGFGTNERKKIQKQFLNEAMARTYLLGTVNKLREGISGSKLRRDRQVRLP